MTDALNTALNRFDAPPISAGLVDRIMAAAATSTPAPFAAPRRDRRGMWRRGRQVLLGTMAVGLLSAGAVASGLLGRVGIEVPVLTAMLAPKPKSAVKPVRVAPKPAATRTAAAVPPPVVAETLPPVVVAQPLSPAERMALREERRERRQAFAAEYPVAAAVIRERVRQELQRRAFARRQALMAPGIDPSIPGAGALDPADRMALARAARRDRLIAEKMIDRRIQAREARLAERQGSEMSSTVDPSVGPPVGPVAQGDTAPVSERLQQQSPEARAARRARFQQMSQAERDQFHARMQQRRAQRLERQGQTN